VKEKKKLIDVPWARGKGRAAASPRTERGDVKRCHWERGHPFKWKKGEKKVVTLSSIVKKERSVVRFIMEKKNIPYFDVPEQARLSGFLGKEEKTLGRSGLPEAVDPYSGKRGLVTKEKRLIEEKKVLLKVNGGAGKAT